ncbi:MAG TPA: TetR/AcrR family transcriptional regulator C-terminal domain-containing protein [Actinomycetota bacterium]|nr:TetR/AcrR family transcriptional regulator C-terminal domain-containing protein [Actinomycetota bacterium]
MANVKTERSSEVREEKSRREPLTRERIIRAALRIMDEEGLEAVSMRRIGRELGVEAMSLYNHVQDKEDILDGICEAVLADFRVPLADEWAEGARLAAHEYRRLLLAHPTVITLMTERKRPFTNAESLRAYEFALEVFRTAGLSEEDSVKAFHVFGGYILGFVTLELGLMVGGPDDEAHAQAHQEMARLLASADLPRMREAMPHFMNCDLAEQFDFGLDLLIEGIRARIAVSL